MFTSMSSLRSSPHDLTGVHLGGGLDEEGAALLEVIIANGVTAGAVGDQDPVERNTISPIHGSWPE